MPVPPSPDGTPSVPPPNGRLTASFRYAFEGMCHVVCSQRNARIHLAISVAVFIVGLLVGLSAVEWAVITVTVALVLMAEMFNSAIEAVVDLAAPHYAPLAKTAKDVAAAGVLTVAIAAVLVGALILGPHLLAWLRTVI